MRLQDLRGNTCSRKRLACGLIFIMKIVAKGLKNWYDIFRIISRGPNVDLFY